MIIYTDPEDIQAIGVLTFPPLEPVSIDLNFDGFNDFEFTRLGGTDGVSFVPLGDNQAVILPKPPPDTGNFLVPLDQNFLIGPDIGDTFIWGSESSLVSACVNIGCIGLFDSQTAYIGTEFAIDGQTHYGWIQFSDWSPAAGGYILDWAYESEPGVPILADAIPIPEPSVYFSLITGLAILTCYRRKQLWQPSP